MLGICSFSVQRVLHETLLIPVLKDSSETMIWKEMSRIKVVQMDNLRNLLGSSGMDKVPNAWIRECRVTKKMDKKTEEGLFH